MDNELQVTICPVHLGALSVVGRANGQPWVVRNTTSGSNLVVQRSVLDVAVKPANDAKHRHQARTNLSQPRTRCPPAKNRKPSARVALKFAPPPNPQRTFQRKWEATRKQPPNGGGCSRNPRHSRGSRQSANGEDERDTYHHGPVFFVRPRRTAALSSRVNPACFPKTSSSLSPPAPAALSC